MKKWNLMYGILMALIGLLVIIFPAFWVKVVVILLGLSAVAYGIYGLKYTKSVYKNTVYEKTILVKSVASIVIGVMAVLFPLTIGETAWTVMIWILIIYLLLAAVLGFYAASLLKNVEGNESSTVNRKKYFLENLGLVAVAVVLILITPKALGTAIIRIIGVAVLVAGVAFILFDIFSKKNEIVVEDVVVTDEDSVKTTEETPDETTRE